MLLQKTFEHLTTFAFVYSECSSHKQYVIAVATVSQLDLKKMIR